MKKIALIFGMAILLGLFAFNDSVNGQAYVNMDETVWLNAGPDVVESTSYLQVVTPSGNINLTMTFELPTTNPFVPENGVAKYMIGIFYMGEFLVDTQALINSNGNVHIDFKLNGSGYVNP